MLLYYPINFCRKMVTELVKNICNSLLFFILVTLTGTFILAAECSNDPNSCTPKQLCEISTKNVGDVKVWADSSDLRSHVEVAKELGINCGNVKDECDVTPEKCKLNQICERATVADEGKLNWNFDNLAHVVLAKEYGLDCNVGQVVDVMKEPTSAFMSKHFNQLDNIKRRELQNGLKKLGYYPNTIDGVWGDATDKSINAFVNDRKIISGFPISVYDAIKSEVEVELSASTQKERKGVNKKLICEMKYSKDFDAIERREKYIVSTKNAFKNLYSLQLSNGKLKFGVYDYKPYETDKWKLFFKVRCRDNKNNWSPCGDFSATVNVQKIDESRLKATLYTPWIWNRGVPPQADMIYTCK